LLEERTLAENEIRHLRNYLSNIIDSMPSALIGVDVEDKITHWNSETVRLTGVSKKGALGKNLAQCFPRLSPEMDLVHAAIMSRKQQVVPKRQYQLDGQTRHEEITIYPLVENGIEGVVIRLDDVTEKNVNEQALRRAQKMDVVGQITGGIAHDFNNILAIVMGNLELLQMELSTDDDALDMVNEALKGTQRGADITRKLLNFSSNRAQETKRIVPRDVIENMDRLIAKSLTVSIDFQTHFSDNSWFVEVDSGDLEDAILNLALNAKDAMPNGGTLIIETTNKVLDDSYAKCNPDSPPGDFVMISVSDEGTGMSQEVKDKALEPFFTTKEQGKGTGLGLSMVYGFVKRSNGHIKIYSEIGEGTTFCIFLPRAKEASQTNESWEQSLEKLPRGTETILVVDDEEALVDIAAEHLNFLGYSVLTAPDAKQALSVMEDNNHIDLLFSDIIMPGKMDGYRLAEAINELYPACKILLASGFTKKRELSSGIKNTDIFELVENRLHKPYSLSELAFAARHTLDGTTYTAHTTKK